MLRTPFLLGLVVVGSLHAQPARPAWEHTGTLRTAVGWRDNALLSPFAPIARAFGQAEVESVLLRNSEQWQVVSFVNGEVLRYFSPTESASGEQQWFGHGEVRWRRWPALRVALKADGFFQDAVVDLSESEAVRTIAPTKVQGGYLTAAAVAQLPAGFSVEPLVQRRRTDYRTFAGDYDESRAGVQLRWSRSSRLALSAAWFEQERDYAHRTQFTAGGRARAGTRLTFWQRTAEVRARTEWSYRGTWDAALVAGRLENRDRSSGFFDYDQRRFGLDLSWAGARWEIEFEGDAKRLDYLLQTVGTGTAPPPRLAEMFEANLRAQRKLSERWSLYAHHRWERSRSNEVGFSYRANTILAGVQREF